MNKMKVASKIRQLQLLEKRKKEKSTYSAFAPRSCTNSWRGRRNGSVAVSNSPLLLLFELQDPSFPLNLNICKELKYINQELITRISFMVSHWNLGG